MIKKYGACLALGMQDAFEYRANFLLSMVSVLFPIIVQLFLWINLFGAQEGNKLFGFSFPQILAYVLYSNIISRLLRTAFEYEINRDIKDGALSVFIVKPASYFGYRMFSFIGSKLIQSAIILIFLVGVIVFMSISYHVSVPLAYIGLFFLSLILSFFLNFTIFFSVGMSGFWLLEIGFLFEAARIILIVFSGGVFPLDVFGETVKSVFFFLPFTYVIYFPTLILTGKLAFDAILVGIGIECVWVIVLAIISNVLFSIGLKRFSAAGG
jgi:ABC-2 type transport system permease protein